MTTDTVVAETRTRLLEAALEVFAERGYREATFREICRRAHANNAAINYHFRDKQRLYLEVIEHALSLSSLRPKAEDDDPSLPADQRLLTYIRRTLDDLLGEGRPTLLLKLMAREMVEPTPGLDLVLDRVSRPNKKLLSVLVAELLGPAATPERIDLCGLSIMGQCLLRHHAHEPLKRLGHVTQFDDAGLEQLADQIWQFSLGGIRAIRQRHEEVAG